MADVLTEEQVAEVRNYWCGRTIYSGSEGQKTLALCDSYEKLRKDRDEALKALERINSDFRGCVIDNDDDWMSDEEIIEQMMDIADEAFAKIRENNHD